LYFYSAAVPYNQPASIETAVIGESTPHVHFKELPSKEPIVVGIYKFRDQTGQYKARNGSTFSTAVTQATSILIKALRIQNGFVL
jgi:curli production assembly/transport component CsgG